MFTLYTVYTVSAGYAVYAVEGGNVICIAGKLSLIMPREYVVSGTIIYGDEFEIREGYVVVSEGRIREVGSGHADTPISGIICPAFINAHTHVGDSIAKDLPYMPLADLVAPPDGLKHRILAASKPDEIKGGMTTTLNDMAATGTCHFADFRENGVAGVQLLCGLAGERATVLGRAVGGDSAGDVLKVADGLGISGANDMPRETMLSMADAAKKARKMLGIHAGELNRSDVDAAMEIDPDFIVHMTNASSSDLRRAHDLDIPVVVCPRSNAATGSGRPPIKEMADSGLLLGLGTDNVMLNGPDMFAELEWVSKAFLHDDAYTLRMATLNGARILGKADRKGSILAGKDADMIVLRQGSNNLSYSKNLLSSIVRRARPDDIDYTIIGGNIWQNSSRRY